MATPTKTPLGSSLTAMSRVARVGFASSVSLSFAPVESGTTERWVDEERIVTKALAPARRVGDHAFDDALGRVLAAGGVHERDDAAEARRPLLGRDITERPEEQEAAARVVEPGPAEPRRAHARRARERVHLDAGIVGERPRPDLSRGRARLQERVGAVGVARLFGEPGG